MLKVQLHVFPFRNIGAFEITFPQHAVKRFFLVQHNITVSWRQILRRYQVKFHLLNLSKVISYAVFCLKKKRRIDRPHPIRAERDELVRTLSQTKSVADLLTPWLYARSRQGRFIS